MLRSSTAKVAAARHAWGAAWIARGARGARLARGARRARLARGARRARGRARVAARIAVRHLRFGSASTTQEE